LFKAIYKYIGQPLEDMIQDI